MNEVKNPKVRKPLIYYYILALLIMLLLNTFLFPALLGRKEVEVDYSTFTTQLAQGNIQQVEVLDQKIEYLLNDEEDNNIYITATWATQSWWTSWMQPRSSTARRSKNRCRRFCTC